GTAEDGAAGRPEVGTPQPLGAVQPEWSSCGSGRSLIATPCSMAPFHTSRLKLPGVYAGHRLGTSRGSCQRYLHQPTAPDRFGDQSLEFDRRRDPLVVHPMAPGERLEVEVERGGEESAQHRRGSTRVFERGEDRPTAVVEHEHLQ